VNALRFHRDLYRGESVDEAVKAFAKFARFDLREEDKHWVVEVHGPNPEREKRIANELANYALGLTLRTRSEKR
jgi:hypothetical protein